MRFRYVWDRSKLWTVADTSAQCGLYRTGDLWAHSKLPADCQPDVVTMAKPLANGFPIGAIMVKETVASGMTAGMCDFT